MKYKVKYIKHSIYEACKEVIVTVSTETLISLLQKDMISVVEAKAVEAGDHT